MTVSGIWKHKPPAGRGKPGEGQPMKHVIIKRDGNMFFAHLDDFTNLQESPAGFGGTIADAVFDLGKSLSLSLDLANFTMEVEPRNPAKLSIEQVLVEAASSAIVNLFKKGDLVMPDYANRVKLPKGLVDRIYAQIDYDKVVAIMAEEINAMAASRIVRAMTEEITSDIKHVLCHQPTRDRLRGVVAAELLSIKSESRAALPGVPAGEVFRCRGCKRPEGECSADPCEAVKKDRSS